MSRRRSTQRVSAAARDAQKKRRNRLMFGGLGVLAIVGLVLAVVLAAGGGGPSRAPNFSFTLYQGVRELGSREMDLSRLQGEPVILNFWAGLCPPCRAEMPEFQRFYEEFKDQVTLVGIDIGPFMRLGSHRDAENLLRELGVTYPAGFTNEGSVPRKYKVVGMPTTVFIKSNGEIFDKRTGALNRNTLARITIEMLRGEAASDTDRTPETNS